MEQSETPANSVQVQIDEAVAAVVEGACKKHCGGCGRGLVASLDERGCYIHSDEAGTFACAAWGLRLLKPKAQQILAERDKRVKEEALNDKFGDGFISKSAAKLIEERANLARGLREAGQKLLRLIDEWSDNNPAHNSYAVVLTRGRKRDEDIEIRYLSKREKRVVSDFRRALEEKG